MTGRPLGRHRDGRPRVAVPPRPWDVRARAEAERLDRLWPRWTVLYGTGTRRFHAIATWPAPEPLIISDRTPEGLETQMHEAETAMNIRPEAFVPAQSGPRLP
ncbi:hypothetical protein AB0395_15965 [Streptosporangium sp. NPDC051023]|uniref:hypothetical protein n=1 Tax=Streptosporangium sp. NPDC051023 TaxID=3155410 RepID=UPI00344F5639